MDLLELSHRLPDFKDAAMHCRYRDCVHLNEPGCEVKQGVENQRISAIRYQNYVDVAALIKQGRRR